MALPIEPAEAYLLSVLDGEMGVDEISSVLGAPVDRTRKMLRRLVDLGAIRWHAPHPSLPPAPTAQSSGPPSSSAPVAFAATERAPALPVPELEAPPPKEPPPKEPPPKEPSPKEPPPKEPPPKEPPPKEPPRAAEEPSDEAPERFTEERKRRIDDAHALIDEADHYEMLGVTREASRKDIREAYFERPFIAAIRFGDGVSAATLGYPGVLRLALYTTALGVTLAGCSVGGGTGEDAGMDAGMDAAVVPGDAAPGCAADIDCSDRIACTVDHCVDGACEHSPCIDCCPEGLECLVGVGCGAIERCTEDAECVDSVRCTLDSCRDGERCEHRPQHELCDEGESCFPALGCIPSPPETCATADDCTGGNECYGEWSCQPEFGCAFVSPPDCDDGDDCTVDGCDLEAGACTHAVRDADEDGFGDAACGADDCDDADPETHPGAPEICDGDDDDCDGSIDETCCEEGLGCTTSCGTAGTTTCTADGTEGPCMPPDEICNGADDDCDGAADQTFECVRDAARSCATACGSTGMQTCVDCAWGPCLAPTEVCGGGDDDCDGTTDEGFACVAGASGSCATSCGSTGTRDCLGDCSWDTCVPPDEICNGADDDCDGAADQTFACVRDATRSCATTCGSTGMQTCVDCAWGPCLAPTEVCGGGDDDCDGTTDEGFACEAGASGSCATSCGSTGTRDCLGDCSWDTCVPPAEICNGADDDCDLACDDGFACCQGSTQACSSLGYVSGTATCRSDCGGWDTSGCSNCGNATVDGGEQCDGSDLDGNDCASVPGGFGSGTLACTSACVFDTSGCSRCQNGTIDPGEQCDGSDLGGDDCTTIAGGYDGGTLGCTSGCAFDTSMCTSAWDPDGHYTLSPSIAYSCAFGLVNLSYPTFTFVDDGTTLTVSQFMNGGCQMQGASAENPTRDFMVSCSYPGTCTETYTLTGSFTGGDTWSGTWTVQFVGSCFDCANQTVSVSGTR